MKRSGCDKRRGASGLEVRWFPDFTGFEVALCWRKETWPDTKPLIFWIGSFMLTLSRPCRALGWVLVGHPHGVPSRAIRFCHYKAA